MDPPAAADEIPGTRPGVTAHERLWAQMETLQQDMDRARGAQRAQSLASTTHAEALDKIHKLQLEFAQQILGQDQHLGLDHYKELWAVGDPDMLRARLFDDPHFPALDENVAKSAAAVRALTNALDRIPSAREHPNAKTSAGGLSPAAPPIARPNTPPALLGNPGPPPDFS